MVFPLAGCVTGGPAQADKQTYSGLVNATERYMLGNRRLLIILLGIPFLYISLFGILYSRHVITHITTVVYDMNQSGLSREMVQAFRDSQKFGLLDYVDDESQLNRALADRRAVAALVIPPDFARVKSGRQGRLLVVVNGTNMLYSNAVVTQC